MRNLILKDNRYIKTNNLIGSFKNVHLIGQVIQREISGFYKMAGMFVCVSRDEPDFMRGLVSDFGAPGFSPFRGFVSGSAVAVKAA